jgi:hypothetical protein
MHPIEAPFRADPESTMALTDATEELWQSIRSDLIWDDGWDNTRSALRSVVNAAREEGKEQVWELIERVLRHGLTLESHENGTYSMYSRTHDAHFSAYEPTVEQAVKKAMDNIHEQDRRTAYVD